MNQENITKWVTQKLPPNLHQPSVIVLDNASYHSVRTNKPSKCQWQKIDILKKWLDDNDILYTENALKAELYDLI